MRHSMKKLESRKALTKREIEIVSLLSTGLTSRQISQRLFISETTVVTHRKHILKKLNATNSAALIKIAIQESLI